MKPKQSLIRPQLALTLAAALLAGCAAGPDYRKPSADIPAAWKPEAPWREGTPNDGLLKGNWWELFGDTQLNVLAQQALAQNQSLRIAAARFEQARAQLSISSAALVPGIGLSAGATRAKISADRPLSNYGTSVVSTVQNDFKLGLAISYEADLFGRVRRDVEGARASAEQAEADFENVRLVLISELASAYINLRALDAEIDVVRQSIGLQQHALDFIQARHDLGAVSGLDLAQQQAQLDASTTQIELLRNRRGQYEHAIAMLIGIPAPAFTLAPATTMPASPALPVGLPSDVLQRRPDVAAAERAMAAANARIGVASAAYFPHIELLPTAGWESRQFSTLLNASSIFWSLGIAATQSLFDAGKTRASVQIAEAGYMAAVGNYRQTVLTAMQEVENGITGLASLSRVGERAEASVQSSQRALNLANDRYAGGLATYLDVITTQQTLLTNQRLTVQIHGQQLLTSVYLVKALGGGWQGYPPQATQ